MKTRILWLIFVSALLCFTSCDQFSIPDNQIKLDQTEFNLPAAGGEIKVSFVPLSAWSVMCSDPSVKLTPSSGEKSDELISLVIKVDANKSEEEKIIKILLTFETDDIVLTVKQAAAIPDTPDNPDIPDNPDTPDNPDIPDTPEGSTGSTEDVIPGADLGNN